MHTPVTRRVDIQGLRALAVFLVIAGHLFPGSIPGGFIGVDIFFVISGFVITQQMISLQEKFPHTFLRSFYARRIRRILPSALLVLISSYLATKYFLGVVVANDFTKDGFWATIFLANFHFQAQSLDYFAAGIAPSPIQHYWSLSIEEQFYLIWPAIFLLTGYLNILRINRRVFLGLIAFLSLLSSLYLSEISSSPIFFDSISRVWEIALGALCALIGWRKSSNIVLELTCIGTLLAAALLINQSMQWPRLTTLPVVALTCILLARKVPSETYSFLSNPLAQYIGDLSFLLYLWHWPILIIVKSQNQIFGITQAVLVFIVTLVLSIAVHHLFENPLRRANFLIGWPRLTIIGGLFSLAIVAAGFHTLHQG